MMSMYKRLSLKLPFSVLASALVMGALPNASAQIAPPVQSWADAPRPEYDALGLPLGGFDLFPYVSADAAYNSNVLAAPTGELDDVVLTVRPSLSLQSNWSRHNLRARAFVESAFYTSVSTEDHTDFGLSANGSLDVTGRTLLFASADYTSRHEDRTFIDTLRDTVEPVQLDNIVLMLGGKHRFNSLSVELRGHFNDINVDDGISSLGAVVDQDFRDVQQASGELTLSYEFSPGYSAFTAVRYDDNNFDFGLSDPAFVQGTDLVRDFTTLRIDAGLTAEVTEVLYATFGIGYLKSEFEDPIRDSIDTVSLRADLLWNVTGLSSIVATAKRTTQATADLIAVARLDTTFEIGVDHELLYNVVLVGRVNYGSLNFQGLNRTDDQYGALLEARYLFNNQWRAQFQYRFDQRDSNVSVFQFTRHTVTAGLRFAF